MKFKEKRTVKRTAIIYLRYLDNCNYKPLLTVLDTQQTILFKTNLPEVKDLRYLGDIQLSTRKIIIQPRKCLSVKAKRDSISIRIRY